MKRYLAIVLALALCLLAACGTPTPAATDTPSPAPEDTTAPTAEASPEASTEPESVPVDFHLPDAGFEPDSYWLSDGFGKDGQALMLTATAEDGTVQFKCWYNGMAEIYSDTDNDFWESLVCESFAAADGTATVAIDGETLTVSYAAEAGDIERPAQFERATYDEALAAFRAMPYNGEAALPIATQMTRAELEALPGIELSGDGYVYNGMELGIGAESFSKGLVISSIRSTNPESAPDVRGIKIGSSSSDVLACFPGNVTEVDPDGENVTIYGPSSIRTAGAWIVHTDDGGVQIVVSDFVSQVTFEIEDGLVSAIGWSEMIVEP